MPSGAQLLDRITADIPAQGPICAPLKSVLNPLTRSYWDASVAIDRERLSPDHYRILASHQVAAYRLGEGVGWATPGDIQAAFVESKQHRAQTGSGKRSTPLPEDVLSAPLKLIVRDNDAPIECAVAWEPVYPQRAWVGLLHPHFDPPMAFVIAGLLNSAIGQVSYRRLHGEQPPRGHDLRKSTLWELRVPILAYDRETFDRAATLSYRLHCLYAAKQQCQLPAQVDDEDIPNHWEGLLSELVRLYGYPEKEARQLVETVLPEGLTDVPGAQLKLYYRPKAPLRPLQLFDRAMKPRYEQLKQLARSDSLDSPEATELANFRALLAWEDRANRGIPARLAPTPWPGVLNATDVERAAYRYLSTHKGQSYRVEHTRQSEESLWQVSAIRQPRHTHTPEDRQSGVDLASPLTLWVNAASGVVSEDRDAARHAGST